MAVYVGDVDVMPEEEVRKDLRRFGNAWANLTADSDAELHAFARRMGLPRQFFDTKGGSTRQEDRRYCLTPGRHGQALRLGGIREHYHEFQARVDRARAADPEAGARIERLRQLRGVHPDAPDPTPGPRRWQRVRVWRKEG